MLRIGAHCTCLMCFDSWVSVTELGCFEFLFFACVLHFEVVLCVFACIGYCEFMFQCMYSFCLYRLLWIYASLDWLSWLGLTSFPDCHGKSGQRPGNENNLPCIGFCLPVVLSKPRTEVWEEKLAWRFWWPVLMLKHDHESSSHNLKGYKC